MKTVFSKTKLLFSLVFFGCIISNSIFAKENKQMSQGYTINYKNVSLIEYIKFVGKITSTNFIYDEQELQNLTISVTSDEPITKESLMSTLIQSLRIHEMQVLEQDNSLLITKSTNVKQLAKVSKDNEKINKEIPILTKVFKIQNTSVESIAAIINSMISNSAILDVLPETRQIVLTDITTNLEKIELLIENLDSPETPLEIKSYHLKHNQPSYIINLANQLMAPLASGNPFILVPQESTNTIYIVSTPRLVEKSIAIFNSLDIESKTPIKGESIFIYQPKEISASELIKALKKISTSLKDSNIYDKDLANAINSLEFIPETNSILFTGSVTSISKIKEFLATIDSDEKSLLAESMSFFIYRPKNLSLASLKNALNEYADELSSSKYPNISLIDTLKNSKMVPTTNSLLFTGSMADFERIKEILSSIDTETNGDLLSHKKTFWMYKLENISYPSLIDALSAISKDLKKAGVDEKDLIETIDSVKYMPDTNSLLFTGPESGIKKLKALMDSFDQKNGLLPVSNQFLIYHPKEISGEQILESLKELAQNFETSNLADPALLRAIESGKYASNTQSLIFTGDLASLQKLELLLKDVDSTELYKKSQYFIYPLKFVSKDRAEEYLKQVIQNLSKSGLKNEPIIQVIKSMRYVPESRSLMFSGPESVLEEVKQLLNSFDTPEEEQKHALSSYFLYKLQNVSGAVVEEDLDKFANNLKATGLKDQDLINVLENAKWVKETNSILLTGYPKTLEEAKNIVAQFDVKRDASGIGGEDFLMYKPKNIPAEIIQKSLDEVASSLRRSDLSDSALLSAIKSAKYNETTQSFIFTGTPDALKKLQALLDNIDDESSRSRIQQIGKTTFLLYKLKNASGAQIQSSIRQIAKDLKRSGTADTNFLETLNSMKYVPETNSLLFTGDSISLEKVQALVEKFDISSLAGPVDLSSPSENFYIYKPKYLSGPELQKQLEEFADNLKISGLSDPKLYQSLSNTRWIETNKSLIITGNQATIDKVKGLIIEIDSPSDSFAQAPEPTMSPTGSTNFLVYKLQYHKGEQIRAALRSIAKDLLESKVADKTLIETINAIQWIEVTNSLLITGTQPILTRLRELIKSLDIPLKQVFIEVLVIETSLTNTLSFGLDWLGKGKWKDKASISYNNLSSQTAGSTFPNQFEGINATNTPVPTDIPFSNGFSLGAIGDIIFHKGKSFVSMGSLMQALQQDEETVIVTTPKVFAQDSKKSTLFIGFNIPFIGSFVQNAGANTLNTTNIEYRDIGVDLEITPVLGNSDVVTLQLNLSRQQTTDQQNLVVNNVQGITTSKTSLETTFHVPNNHFLILTGMVTQTKNKTKSGIPCLGGLPLIGAAFSLNRNIENDRNVVIFLKPHIISSLEEMQHVTEQQEDLFRQKAGNVNLENEFDEAMENIKSYEDE
jgi:type III secretion protein C